VPVWLIARRYSYTWRGFRNPGRLYPGDRFQFEAVVTMLASFTAAGERKTLLVGVLEGRPTPGDRERQPNRRYWGNQYPARVCVWQRGRGFVSAHSPV